jgi:hypothetical protein
VYLRARWYAPGQGRFVSEDPFAGWATRPYSLHAYQYAYSNPVRWTDPSGRCVPEWVPGGEPGCTLRAGIGQGRLDWQGAGDYAWDVVEGVGLPGAMAVDAIAGTNGTQQILDDAGTGTYLGVAFTSVTTLGSMQSGGAISNAALRGQVWLTSGSRLAVGVGLVGLGLNAADEGVLWLRTLRGDCDAFGEWAALQQLGAADGLLPFGDVLAAGMLLPGRRWGPSGGRPVLRGDPYHPDRVDARRNTAQEYYGPQSISTSPRPHLAHPRSELPTEGQRRYMPPHQRGNPEIVNNPQGAGYIDADGNVWIWAHDQHAGPHWDVQHPNGGHTNVGPDGSVIGNRDNFPNVPR